MWYTDSIQSRHFMSDSVSCLTKNELLIDINCFVSIIKELQQFTLDLGITFPRFSRSLGFQV